MTAPPRGGNDRQRLRDMNEALLVSSVRQQELTEQAERSEAKLRVSEGRQAFLLTLSDVLRSFADPTAIAGAACRLLGEALDADRAYYVEVDEGKDVAVVREDYVRADLPSLVRAYPLSGFRWVVPIDGRGRPVVVADMWKSDLVSGPDREAMAAARVVAWIAVPLVERGESIGALCVAQTEPRTWTEAEVALARETAERIRSTIERARVEAALREREAELARIQRVGQVGGTVIDLADGFPSYRSREYRRLHGLAADTKLETHADWVRRLHPDDRVPAEKHFLDAVAAPTGDYEGEYRIVRPSDGEVRWILAKGEIERDAGGRALRLVGAHIDVTALKRVEEALRRSEALFRTLATSVPQLVFLSRPDGWRTWGSPQWIDYAAMSLEDSIGFGWMDAIHGDDRAATTRGWTEAKAAGDYYVEHRVRRGDDGAWRWHQTRARLFHPDAGATGEWVGTMTDIHDLRQLQEQQKVLIAELQHRTRNLLAVVRSIARQTADASRSPDDFLSRFDDRLAALARVQGLLSRTGAIGVTLGELLRMELAALGDEIDTGRVVLAGPEVLLAGNAVQTFALALHEMATNARKYGALAAPRGRLSVTWSVAGENGQSDRVALDWVESGVEGLAERGPPARRGFGRELIERALPYQMDATTRFELGPDGARWFIDMPLGQ